MFTTNSTTHIEWVCCGYVEMSKLVPKVIENERQKQYYYFPYLLPFLSQFSAGRNFSLSERFHAEFMWAKQRKIPLRAQYSALWKMGFSVLQSA